MAVHPIRFRSGYSVVGALIVFLAAGLLIFESYRKGTVVLAVVGILILTIYHVLYFGLQYELTETQFSIKLFGKLYRSVLLDEIVSIAPTGSMSGAMAFSLNRMCLECKHIDLVISPARPLHFVYLLRELRPDIEVSPAYL